MALGQVSREYRTAQRTGWSPPIVAIRSASYDRPWDTSKYRLAPWRYGASMQIVGKRVLVTGGAGFIGSHLVEDLAGRNEVAVLDNFSSGSLENLTGVRSQIRIIRGDITNPDDVEAAVQTAEVIFHLAVDCLRASIMDPLKSQLVNDRGTINLLASAREHAIERFIYVSSSEVYGTAQQVPMTEDHPLRPSTPYAAAKLAGEAYTLSFHRTYGLPGIVVRPFNAYGPRAHLAGPSGEVIPKFVVRAMAGKPLNVFGDGLQTRDYTWVEDVARGIRLAAECDDLLGDCVNIARGQEVRILDLARSVQRILGTTVPIEHHPSRPGDVRRHLAGVLRSRRLFGFVASVDIEEGLERYVNWLKTLPGDPHVWLDGEEIINWQRVMQPA